MCSDGGMLTWGSEICPWKDVDVEFCQMIAGLPGYDELTVRLIEEDRSTV